jgi:hypothetical protein
MYVDAALCVCMLFMTATAEKGKRQNIAGSSRYVCNVHVSRPLAPASAMNCLLRA